MAPAQVPEIRRRLRPGDLGEIVRLQAVCYAAEYGLDVTFEASVAERVGVEAARGWPHEDEGVWLAERGGRLTGCLALTHEGGGRGTVRWFIVDPSERGHGLGRRLLGELLAQARRHAYVSLGLLTFSELRAAAHLYRDAGFRCVETTPERRWGRELEMQRYELQLDAAIRGAA